MDSDPLTEALRGKVREMILALAEAELNEVLEALPYERTRERRGYRNGSKQRSLTTGLGKTTIEVPRARLITDEGEQEWQSRLVERYQRRAASVDGALLGAYLTGANQRRIKGALSPLLRGAPLSKSAISRLVGRLKALFQEWRKSDLGQEKILLLYLDAIALKVRIAKKVVRCINCGTWSGMSPSMLSRRFGSTIIGSSMLIRWMLHAGLTPSKITIDRGYEGIPMT